MTVALSSLGLPTTSRGTASYRAPELITHNANFTNKVDIWALGCILLELCESKRAFKSDWNVYEYAVAKKPPQVFVPGWPRVLQLHLSENVQELLNLDWRQRPMASEALVIFFSYRRLLNSATVDIIIGNLEQFPSYSEWKNLALTMPIEIDLHKWIAEASKICEYQYIKLLNELLNGRSMSSSSQRPVPNFIDHESHERKVDGEHTTNKSRNDRAVIKAENDLLYSGPSHSRILNRDKKYQPRSKIHIHAALVAVGLVAMSVGSSSHPPTEAKVFRSFEYGSYNMRRAWSLPIFKKSGASDSLSVAKRNEPIRRATESFKC